MKTFEEALKRAIDSALYIPGLDDGGYNEGFIDGLEYALQLIDEHKDDAIDEILEDYQGWEILVPREIFIKWAEEEKEDFADSQARIRREFIEYLNKKG